MVILLAYQGSVSIPQLIRAQAKMGLLTDPLLVSSRGSPWLAPRTYLPDVGAGQHMGEATSVKYL